MGILQVCVIRCGAGRLEISLAPIWDARTGWLPRWRVDQFQSREELMQCLISATYIPLFSSLLSIPSFRNRYCIDGGLW